MRPPEARVRQQRALPRRLEPLRLPERRPEQGVGDPRSDARGNETNDTEPRPSQVLLELEVLITRDEDLEPAVRGSLKQVAVLQT